MCASSLAVGADVVRGVASPLERARRARRGVPASRRFVDAARRASHAPHARAPTRARVAIARVIARSRAASLARARVPPRAALRDDDARARPMSADTASLVANARQQIARLLTQLADLEDAREVRRRRDGRRRRTDGRMDGWIAD